MTEKPHLALILAKMDFISATETINLVSRKMSEFGTVVAASSVYKRYLNERSEDLNSELVMVAKIKTNKSEMELFRLLKTNEIIPGPHQFGRTGKFLLLSYDQKTRMVPGQNLPHLLLRTDLLVLRCAAEAWGDYEHPVLGQSLNEIVGLQTELASVEFFSQFSFENSHAQEPI